MIFQFFEVHWHLATLLLCLFAVCFEAATSTPAPPPPYFNIENFLTRYEEFIKNLSIAKFYHSDSEFVSVNLIVSNFVPFYNIASVSVFVYVLQVSV